MPQEGEIAEVLRDLISFLGCLEGVDLPEKLRNPRESLLARTRAALQLHRQIVAAATADSPEPYLDMNAGKSLQRLSSTDETDQPREYVNTEVEVNQQRGSLIQHYYETFQDLQPDNSSIKSDPKTISCNAGDKDKDKDNLVFLYAGFTAAQAKDKAIKSGTLTHLKREKKMFAPFNILRLDRSCWVSLVGSHLLLYTTERDSRPYLVQPLRGYKSRPAPSALPRDPKRSEAAFEVYCPGDLTFQFVAKSAQDMQDWVDIVSQSLEPEEEHDLRPRMPTFSEILELDANERMCIEKVKEEKEKERYQDVLNTQKAKPVIVKAPTPEKEKVKAVPPPKVDELVPPLPARSRRLPSLPSQESLSNEPREELYEEDGLYHAIEDVKAQREYQNLQFGSVLTTRDNAAAATIDLLQQTYDDVANSRETSLEPYELPPITYDNIPSAKERSSPEKEPKSPKTPKPSLTRSFLDRVRIRKDSFKKDDKKSNPSSPTSITAPMELMPQPPDIPSSDVSSLTSRETSVISEEEYLCPPPPRPIYSRPPTIIKCAVPGEEIYDDIGSCLEHNGCRGCNNVDVIQNYPKNGSFLSDLQLSIEGEHYQVPKSNSRVVIPAEEIYDDVAIFESFKSRPRDSVGSEKSIWSRIGSGRRLFEHVNIRQTLSSGGESSDTCTSESNDLSTTTFKPISKLISKMENSLGKSAKVNGVNQN